MYKVDLDHVLSPYIFSPSPHPRCTQLGTRVTTLTQELREEQEMNRCLRANQTELQGALQDEERRKKEEQTVQVQY